MKIGYLIEQCWHRVPGGTAVAAVGLARALALRPDVDLVGLAARHKNLTATEIGSPIPVVHSALPRVVLYEFWRLFGYPRIDRLVGDVDLVHASGGAVPATNRPVVATIHDVSWRHNPDWTTRRGRRLSEGWLNDSRRAQKVICPSFVTRDDLIACGFDKTQLRVVPIGVDAIEVDSRLVTSLRSKWELNGPVVLWVGTIEPRKNLKVLVEAVSQIPEAILVIVGPEGWGPNPYEIFYPLGDRVRLVGPVDELTKRGWYETADVFCYPSLLEGFGLPVAESMAQGTPVVTSVGTATEEVAGGAALTVNPNSAVAVAEAISSVLFDVNLSHKLRDDGLNRVKSLTWLSAAESTMAVYQEVLDCE